MVILNALHWSHSSTILEHFSPFTHTTENTLYPHWAGKCKFWLLSITPPTTNHNPLFFLGANWQHCSQIHRPNETNMVQCRQTIFWNVSSHISVLPNVSSLACSCSKLLNSLSYLTVTQLQNISCKTSSHFKLVAAHPAPKMKPALYLPAFLHAYREAHTTV